MKSAISFEDEKYYLHLKKLFSSIKNEQLKYNWLITNCECYPEDSKVDEKLSNEYCFLTGEELTALIENDDFQWIWGVLSGFDKEITLDKILEYELPYADGSDYLWVNPVHLQHPLAKIEIIAFDSTYAIIKSIDASVIDNFKRAYPLSQDLEEYNRGLSKKT